MTKKSQKASTNAIPAAKDADDEREEVTITRTVTDPSVRVAATIRAHSAADGDLELAAQARTLDAIFNTLAQRALGNMVYKSVTFSV